MVEVEERTAEATTSAGLGVALSAGGLEVLRASARVRLSDLQQRASL